MKIKFERTGGFANIPVNVELDTEKLSEENSEKLSSLATKVLVENLQEENNAVIPDGFTYKLEVCDGDDNVKNITRTDANLTDEAQDLFDLIIDQSDV